MSNPSKKESSVPIEPQQQTMISRRSLTTGALIFLFSNKAVLFGWGLSVDLLRRRLNLDSAHDRAWPSSTSLQAAEESIINGTSPDNLISSSSEAEESRGYEPLPPLSIHHIALKTRDLKNAEKFYSLLGYEMTVRFRAGPARAAWLELRQGGIVSRIEVLEVPAHILLETPGTRKRSFDMMQRADLLGYHHIALDVTEQVQKNVEDASLTGWLEMLNQTSFKEFGRTIRIAMEPTQQMIGQNVYELAFLYDPDGCLVELLHYQATLVTPVTSGWEPWLDKDLMKKSW